MEAPTRTAWQRFGHSLVVVSGGVGLALVCFLVLPLLQAITQPDSSDQTFREVGTTELPPPPPPVDQEDEPEPDDEPPPPDMDQEAPPLDLSELEMTLSPSFGGSGAGGSFTLPTNALLSNAAEDMTSLFDMSGLEEKPRVIYRARPEVSRAMEKRMPCTVFLIMTVDEQGRVVDPTVLRSDDPLFEGPALKAIRQWTFEPGKRGGKPSSFRVRQPITFQ